MKPLLFTLTMVATAIVPLPAHEWVEGSTQPYQRITLSSPVEDIVDRVLVEEGDIVKEGDILGELRLTRSRLEVERLDGFIEKARFDYEATVELHRQRIESREMLNERKAELDRLLIERQIAWHDLEERIIRAPIDGSVVFRLKDPGESIGRVEPIFEIIDSSRLRLTFFLPSNYLTVLESGMEVEVTFPELSLSGPHHARLIFIDPQVDSRSGLFRARFEFDNSEGQVPPGVRVRCRLPAPRTIASTPSE